MTTFTINEDFPKSEVEFHDRFSDPKACFEYLFQQKCLTGLSLKVAAMNNTGTVSVTFTFVPNVNINTR